MNKSTLAVAAIALLGLATAGLTLAQHDKAGHQTAGQKMTITAHVVDSNCYIVHNGIGEKHVTCAETCAKAGIPLALLDTKANVLYLALVAHHKNANPMLLPYIEKDVKVTGVLAEKNGMKALVIDTVEAAK